MIESSVKTIQGIGPNKAAVLKREAGIDTIEDLLYYPPRRYVDRSVIKSIADCFLNDVVTVGGMINRVQIVGKRKKFLEVVIDDGTDTLAGIFFRGLQYFPSMFHRGDFVLFSGKIDFFRIKQIIHPDFDFIDEDSQIKSIHAGRVIPLYRSTEKLKSIGFDSRGFRRIIRRAIDDFLGHINDPIDGDVLTKLNLLPLDRALFSLHFPESPEEAERARKRLSFNELFFLHYYLGLTKQSLKPDKPSGTTIRDTRVIETFTTGLPFRLTKDQLQSIHEISADILSTFPMNRLLQGDVGSGKTVVAVAAALVSLSKENQAAMMAPTEILAQQHYRKFLEYVPPGVEIALLTGSVPSAQRRSIIEKTSRGEIDILIGTHALIYDEVRFKNPGLIIIDEQHRFGVNQRARLREKGTATDLLVMTATPIPRSLALTLYADLDVSQIREKPAGRPEIKTLAFPESRLGGVYNSLNKYIDEGRQIYYVLPLIEESEKLDLKSAKETYSHLKENVFQDRSVDLLHGKMKSIEKESIMKRFQNGDTDILVSTTVIEVGIDVPNATVMVIEHAERFGLSQLHQLRGRVGRGSHQSFCALVYPDDTGAENRKRIDIMTSVGDGFHIAEEDLKIRGAGELIGFKQHGHDSGFEFTNLVRDVDIIEMAKKESARFIDDGIEGAGSTQNAGISFNLPGRLKGLRFKRVLSLLS